MAKASLKPCILILIVAAAFIHCGKKPNDQAAPEKTTVISSLEKNIKIEIPTQDIGGNKDAVLITALFMPEGIILRFDSESSLSRNATVEVGYGDKLDSVLTATHSAYLFRIDDSGLVPSSSRITLDNASKKLTFSIDRFAAFFISPSQTITSALSCTDGKEYIFYLALKSLKALVDDLAAHFDSYTQVDRCARILAVYWAAQLGSSFMEEYKIGSGLLRDWLTGDGKRNEPVKIDNDKFNESNTDWRALWELSARKRAESAYRCERLHSGPSGSLEMQHTGGGQSTTNGIGSFDLWTQGTCAVDCDGAGNTSFHFEIAVNALDTVNFNVTGHNKFRFDRIVCGEPVAFVIPDAWGLYLRDQCGIGQDYLIQGESTSFAFGAADFPARFCSECQSDTSAGSYFDINFDQYNWWVEIDNDMNNDTDDGVEQNVLVSYEKHEGSGTPAVVLKIDGEICELQNPNDWNWWTGKAYLTPGRRYSFEVWIDGKKHSATLRIPHNPKVIFPEQVSQSQDAEVSWTLRENAQYQLALASSGEGQDDDELFAAEVSPMARKFVFPAGCVRQWGDPASSTDLMIREMNIALIDDLFLRCNGYGYKEYDQNMNHGAINPWQIRKTVHQPRPRDAAVRSMPRLDNHLSN